MMPKRERESEDSDLVIGSLSRFQKPIMTDGKINKLKRNVETKTGGWNVAVMINNNKVECQVDTGDDANILSKKVAKELGCKAQRRLKYTHSVVKPCR